MATRTFDGDAFDDGIEDALGVAAALDPSKCEAADRYSGICQGDLDRTPQDRRPRCHDVVDHNDAAGRSKSRLNTERIDVLCERRACGIPSALLNGRRAADDWTNVNTQAVRHKLLAYTPCGPHAVGPCEARARHGHHHRCPFESGLDTIA